MQEIMPAVTVEEAHC